MAIKLDKEKFKRIDEEFAAIRENKSSSGMTEHLNAIESVLNSSFDMHFNIVVIKPKRNDPFYIMSIFPEESTLDKLVEAVLNEENDTVLKTIWNKNKNI